MKNIILFFLLVLLINTSCEMENKTFESEKEAIKEKISFTNGYSWENFESGKIFGEILFIPIYSSIYHQNDKIFDLSATLSIHNIDINSSITITKVNYYNSDGEFIRNFIKEAFELKALQSKQFIIKESDISGGTAAKFIIQWYSKQQVLKPFVEAVMISTSSQQGISFKTESKVIGSIGYK